MTNAMGASGVEDCRAKVLEYCKVEASKGFDEVAFAKLGPDHDEAFDLIGKKIHPAM